MRKRRRQPDRRLVRFAEGASIAARPKHVTVRDVPGHWEGDLIVGRHNRSAIGTLVERHSRYTRLVHLPASHDADDMHRALTQVLLTLPKDLRLTLDLGPGWERWPVTPKSPCSLMEGSSSLTQPVLGSAARTRTPMVFSASIFQKAPISLSTPKSGSLPSKSASTTDLAKSSDGPLPLQY